MATVRLFAYGTLRPTENPPHSARNSLRDAIRGDEIEHESPEHYAEVTRAGTEGEPLVHGYTMEISADELPDLDKREAPEYRRKLVTTQRGHKAYVYEYARNTPESRAEADSPPPKSGRKRK